MSIHPPSQCQKQQPQRFHSSCTSKRCKFTCTGADCRMQKKMHPRQTTQFHNDAAKNIPNLEMQLDHHLSFWVVPSLLCAVCCNLPDVHKLAGAGRDLLGKISRFRPNLNVHSKKVTSTSNLVKVSNFQWIFNGYYNAAMYLKNAFFISPAGISLYIQGEIPVWHLANVWDPC